MPPETLFERMGEQQAHARRTDPDPSHEAARAVTPGLPDLQALVERFALGHPDGFLDVELCAWRSDLGPSTLRTRRGELAARNIILDSGRRRRPNGASVGHTVWIHRSFVPDAPPIKEPAHRATDADRAEALDMASKLEAEARDLKRRGFEIFAKFLLECAEKMRVLAA